MHSW